MRFFGNLFGEEQRNLEFVYKEPSITPLAEVCLRLQHQFGQRFGPDKVALITDSKDVDPATLTPNMAYLQIIFVEPHFDEPRKHAFDRVHDVRDFAYEVRRSSQHNPDSVFIFIHPHDVD